MPVTNKWNLEMPNLEKPSISEKHPTYGILRILIDIGEIALSFVAPETIAVQSAIALGSAVGRTTISAEQGTLTASEAVIDFAFAFLPAFSLARKSRNSLNKVNQLTEKEIKTTFPKLYSSRVNSLIKTGDKELLKSIEKSYGVSTTNRYLQAATYKTLLNSKKTEAVAKSYRNSLNRSNINVVKLRGALKNGASRTANRQMLSRASKLLKQVAKKEELSPSLTSKILTSELKLPRLAFKKDGSIKIFNTTSFHSFVQAVHFIDPKLAARKIVTKSFKKVNKILKLDQNGLLGIAIRKIMKLDLLKTYKAYLLLKDNKLVPLNAKMGFTLAYREHAMDAEGLLYMVTLYFNPLNTRTKAMPRGKDPVFLYPMTQKDIVELQKGTGSYYLDHWAVSRGGRALNLFDNPIAASVLSKFRYGFFQDTLSLVHHTKKDIKAIMKGDFFSSWGQEFLNTNKRLAPHKVGKLIGGRYGLAYVKGHQGTKTINGRKTTVYKSRLSKTELYSAVGIGARKYARKYESTYTRTKRKEMRYLNQYHRIPNLIR